VFARKEGHILGVLIQLMLNVTLEEVITKLIGRCVNQMTLRELVSFGISNGREKEKARTGKQTDERNVIRITIM